ncbi:MAG TPA: hypothetical protein P5280_04385 [Cyclobacteriaceae bacterium]|nr:hypothetical protein [Cyclobacteriaceae bacterium]
MEKKHLIRFLKQSKKGSYSVLVQAYQELIASMPIVMAMEIIQEDLQKETEERIELNYFSLARAVARFKKKNPQAATRKQFHFKDSHETVDVQSSPGRFKIKQG